MIRSKFQCRSDLPCSSIAVDTAMVTEPVNSSLVDQFLRFLDPLPISYEPLSFFTIVLFSSLLKIPLYRLKLGGIRSTIPILRTISVSSTKLIFPRIFLDNNNSPSITERAFSLKISSLSISLQTLLSLFTLVSRAPLIILLF